MEQQLTMNETEPAAEKSGKGADTAKPVTRATKAKRQKEILRALLEKKPYKWNELLEEAVKEYTAKYPEENADIPDIKGKERRKRTPGKEGLLGVEGMSEDIIIDALKKAGCTIDGSTETPKAAREITKSDMMLAGLAGGEGSAELRRRLAARLKLPAKLSANMLLKIVNRLLTYDEFQTLCSDISSSDGEIKQD